MTFSRPRGGTFVLVVVSVLALLSSSCAIKPQEDSRVVIKIPSAETLNASSKIGKFAYAWTNACFMASVKGEGIEMAPPNTCAAPSGVFSGSVAPGAELSIQVPRGSNRQLEVFVFFRGSTSSACPTHPSLASFDPGKTVRVGSSTFDAMGDIVDVPVEISLPSSSTNLITQYSLPTSCSAASIVPADGSSAITAGRTRQTGGNLIVESTVSGRQSEKVLTGGSFVMKLTRRPNEE